MTASAGSMFVNEIIGHVSASSLTSIRSLWFTWGQSEREF